MKSKTYNITITAVFTALICVMSMISIPIGAIPVSMANFAVLLAALILDEKKSVFAVLIYLLCGLCGLPVFAGFKGGINSLFGLSGGFIISYPVICIFIGFLKRYTKKYLLLCFGGLIISYTLGTIYFMMVSGTNFSGALTVCVFPFIVFDILKAIFAVMLSNKLIKFIK